MGKFFKFNTLIGAVLLMGAPAMISCSDGDGGDDENFDTSLTDTSDTSVTDTSVVDTSVTDTADTATEPMAEYVGMATCKTCHPDQYDEIMVTGHPYKLSPVVDGVPVVYPDGTSPFDPAQMDFSSMPGITDWNDVAYMIGGFGWKARFVLNDGNIYTGDTDNPNAQYNINDGSFSAYHTGEVKGYSCGKCHTTGYDPDAASPDGMPGIVGNWSEPGVTCEACHGPGSLHATAPSADTIDGSPATEVCGRCHTRYEDHRIQAKGGYVMHHEQYDELLAFQEAVPASGHQGCETCHDAHMSVLYNKDNAIVAQCTDCHTKTVNVPAMAGLACTDCHMAKTVKSAVAAGPYEGDIASHVFRINTDPAAELTYTDTDAGVDFANPYIPVDFACLSCHTDETKDWAATNAAGIHN